MQQATLININLNDMNHNRKTALEQSVTITGRLANDYQPHVTSSDMYNMNLLQGAL